MISVVKVFADATKLATAPTCDTSTCACYSFSCNIDGKASTGCVVKHYTCTASNKCVNMTADNNTEGCCVSKVLNCVPSNPSRCYSYLCNGAKGCYSQQIAATPESSCFVPTRCDDRLGWQYESMCPNPGNCSTAVYTVTSGNSYTCTNISKYVSNDLCEIVVCDELTGECSYKQKECIPTDLYNIGVCYRGQCFERANITRNLECANMASNYCEKGFCNSSTGKCEIRKSPSCTTCQYNTTLGCSSSSDMCAAYTCAPVDDVSTATKSVGESLCPT